ncbi:putative solute-binding protein [Marinobacter mobilis]|uniref:TRAP-type C4-dicarboxylate transport system, substrate-binding protein n=1 Tax=Marinobacter mobilis TaxID=488533 RepID=A0A1H2UP55_9GAMM|nr:putative solute-binding protein [Marinobacter mobilis]SDW57319.1 TRAP-type C4-dicarboxylate transport system, substrate-binding protein [Marinobacter mobilis]
MRLFLTLMTSVLLSSVASVTQAQSVESKAFCVFDVAGASGYVYQTLQTYQRHAIAEGVRLRMQPYTDEDQVVADFRAGECDMIAVTDMGARKFNGFTGSISAIGAIPRYEDLKVLMYILASPRVARHLEADGYEVMGVAPMGAAYLFVNDRSINNVDALRGKRVTIFEGHEDARHMIRFIGAEPVDAKISNFAQLFNDGQADISYAPGAAYEVLEMFRGMGESGGIVRYPVGQVTVQLFARSGTFDESFVRESRRIVSRLYPEVMRVIREYEDAIPEERWVDIPPEAMQDYQEMLRGVRVEMQDSGQQALASIAYNEDMMTILRKVRCYTNPGADECSSEDRE